MTNLRRMMMKNRMIIERGSLCEWCESRQATDLHELVNRGRTQHNDLARQLSYVEELCSLLCDECHDQAHNPTARNFLLNRNIQTYGREKVQHALDLLKDSMGTQLNIYLPEE